MTHHSPITDGQKGGGMDLTPAVDIHKILSDAILALATLAYPAGTTEDEWVRLVEVDGPKTIEHLDALRAALPQVPVRLKAFPELADDLRVMHEDEATSLDAWVAGREVVEAYAGSIEENGV